MKNINKQKRRLYFMSFFFMGSLALTSCDPVITINKVVYNNSDYDLKLTSSYSQAEMLIPKNSSETISVFEDRYMSVYKTYTNCAIVDYDGIFVNDSIGLPINKNITNENNWFYKVESKYVGECNFTVTNADID